MKRFPGTAVTYAGKITPGRNLLAVGQVTKVQKVRGRKPKKGEWLLFYLLDGSSFRINSFDVVRVFP